MQRLNLPEYKFKIKTEGEIQQIFDAIRRKYVLLTDEEWVRQNFLQFLITEKNFSPSLIAIEMEIKHFNIKKRCDIVVYNRKGKPILIVECKAYNIKITQDTFLQIAFYNMALKVPYLIVTNGREHYCYKIDYKNKSYSFMTDIPNYEEIKDICTEENDGMMG